MQPSISFWQKYKLRLKRRRLLWRSFRSRHKLKKVVLHRLPKDGILAFSVIRNEVGRLPYFLEFYRNAGVAHFLFVDNQSEDGSAEFLMDQPDCSIWQTGGSYRDARFGVDWLTWLMMRYGHKRWCLMVDADELLVFDGDNEVKLDAVTRSLDHKGHRGFGALMLDLYPENALGDQNYVTGQDPREVLTHFDAGPYRAQWQAPKGNLWVQGGVRERVFFQKTPENSPTLNKIPLIKWHRSFAWMNSCHSLLPSSLNTIYDGPGGGTPSGALLHTKFLPEIVSKSETERQRAQHFHDPTKFDSYYRAIEGKPVIWCKESVQYQGPQQLADLRLISSKGWMGA